jgi:aryl-alcohol dehydrogenase-like predicted oxidoreductase
MTLSKFMLGTVQLGIAGYGIHSQTDRVDATALLEQSVQSGINCYDTALDYGDAELKLGAFFQDKEKPFIVSKIKVDLDLSSESELEAQMTERTEAILNRLQLQTLPALMIHDPAMLLRYGDAITRIMKSLQLNGLIQRGGLSLGASPDEQYGYCSDYLKHDIYEFVQVPANLFDRRIIKCGAMEAFNRNGKVVVARSVFLQGLFFHTDGTLPGSLREAAGDRLERLRKIAFEEGISVSQLAVSYVRDLVGIHCLVIGAETQEQIEANLALLNGPMLSEATRWKVENTFIDIPKLLISPSMWT